MKFKLFLIALLSLSIATCNGYLNQSDKNTKKTSPGQVAAPVFTPPAGPFNPLPADVAVATATAGAALCYTTDGTAPACDASKTACAAGTVYSAAITPITNGLTIKAMACKSEMQDSSLTSGTYTLDTTAPTLTASTPANAATGVAVCSGSPCTAKIVLQFSESMQTTTPTLTTEVDSNGTWVATPNTGSTFVWSQTTVTNDTLTITLSWHWFPENSKIRYAIAAIDLQDVAANTIAAQVQQTFTTTWAGRNFTIADTGQTQCSSGPAGDGAMAACPATVTGQDGEFVNIPNARSFIGPTASGSDYTTKDNVTGLVWKSCTEGQTGANCQSSGAAGDNYNADNVKLSWNNAVNQCAALNTANSGAGYANIKTWRLPTKAELETLVDYGVYNPAISSANFPATVASYYWSSSTYVGNTSSAWVVYFDNGYSSNNNKTNTYYVRCVSSGPPAVTPFTDNGNGTVTDSKTNLVWQKCSVGQTNDATCSGAASTQNWQTALTTCNSLSLAGKTWRLPSTNELLSIVDMNKYNPAIDTAFFPATVAGNYWSSSTYVGSTSDAWIVNFNLGLSNSSNKAYTYYVRCVSQ